MKNKIKIHDGIVGTLILLSVILGIKLNAAWIYLAGAISILMIISAFTGFCPVYFVINKLMPDSKDKP
ncbi:MAG: DUF2892 domain-containing protein [Candidatus Omnitrophota bacterium]